MRVITWLIKTTFKALLRIALIILISFNCLLVLFKSEFYEADMHNNNYPRTYAAQTERNMPIYLDKIQRILNENNVTEGNIRLVDKNRLELDIITNDNKIFLTIINNNDKEELKALFIKNYKKIKKLSDLEPPSPDEYAILCDISQSIANISIPKVSTIEMHLNSDVFDKKELQKEQASFEGREGFFMQTDTSFWEYDSLIIRLRSSYDSYTDSSSFEGKDVSLFVSYYTILENNK